MIRSRISAALLFWALPAIAQYREPGSWLPDETAGLGKIVRALISAFDHADVLALGESHWNKLDSDLRIALVRDPGFAKKADFIVVEFASTSEQSILDRYIRGGDVPIVELQRVWRNTTQNFGVWESPVYAEFLAAVRDVNRGLPAAERIRVLAGDPPTGSTSSVRKNGVKLRSALFSRFPFRNQKKRPTIEWGCNWRRFGIK
jgi:Haem-binding uptake, Tiki superfamily, ChaN